MTNCFSYNLIAPTLCKFCYLIPKMPKHIETIYILISIGLIAIKIEVFVLSISLPIFYIFLSLNIGDHAGLSSYIVREDDLKCNSYSQI